MSYFPSPNGDFDWGSINQNANYESPLVKKVMLPKLEPEDKKRQDDAFQTIINAMEAQKAKDAVNATLPAVFKALGVTTQEEALNKIKELQWEIDRLNTMLADAYDNALNGISN